MSDMPPGPALMAEGREQAGTDAITVSSRGALVSVSMALVGLLGYAGTVLLANLLDAPSYRMYAAAAMLVGMVGTFASALIPMPVADVVRVHAPGSEERRQGMAFAWSVCAAAGLAAAAVTGTIAAAFASPTVAAATAVSAGMLFVISPIFGWLQGELRFLRWSVLTVLEVVARVVLSIGAVLLGLGAGGAIAGFAVGVVAVLLITPRVLVRDLAWRPSVFREKGRWSETGGIAVAQLIVAAILAADVVVVAMLHAPAAESAGYQALSTLAKAPAYVAAGAAVVAFPLLRGAHARVHEILTAALRSFALLAFPAATLVATVPPQLVLLVIPERYAGSLRLLPALAVEGLGFAALTLFATVMVALRAYRRCQVGLLVAVVVMPAGIVFGWLLAGVPGVAIGVATAALAAAGGLWIAAAPLLPPGTLRRTARGLLLTAVLVAGLALARSLPFLWTVCAVLLGGIVLRLARRVAPKAS
jgi:O-antigen/teichoic acid export membrane protein